MQPAKVVDGIDIFIEGEGAETIVMIHGWPDTYRLWDAQVAELKQRYRCVRFTLPGFDIRQPRRSYSLDATMRVLLHIVNSVSQKQKVILMLHDWGCVFGYEFYMRNKGLVSAIIGVDIGDAQSKATARSRSVGQKMMVASYQSTLALAWAMGGPLGDVMTKATARMLGVPSPREYISSRMNYPYYILTAGASGSYHSLVPFAPQVPMLYIYGTNKPFMFHSPQWTETLAAREGCKVVAMETDHWPMVRAPERFNDLVINWLDKPADEASEEEDAA
ncbi:pimeloyl-ACP methyl ester carboxylesterase [Duganella sp. SG902]|uniref:alpha/beta fold hydrolase n=1 Tax=Duganella sp. SG902 TaxID=2587016 RepID=UPI00159CF899|nr:alpha/beta hydrolase [Duganella sp. SG902]NVM79163.1 pimeloyl-ACP methyl ester carboxylesterase [Duganella sp. SG902]